MSFVMSSVDSSYYDWADRRVHLEVIETWARRYGGVDLLSVDAELRVYGAEVEWALCARESGLQKVWLTLTVRDRQFSEVVSDRLQELGLPCFRSRG